jgi:UMP-CMP kinase
MKRTKDRFGKFENYNDHNISSLKVFEGEDLEYQDRMKYQKMQQNYWLQQQKYENEMKKLNEREEERRYAEQTLAINRMRSMLESEHEQKIRDMNHMQKDYNLKLADFKKAKEAKEKKDEDDLDSYNIQDAEDTRNRAYNFMKNTIDQMADTIENPEILKQRCQNTRGCNNYDPRSNTIASNCGTQSLPGNMCTKQTCKPQIIFVMGGPGAGKGTQCKRIVEEFGFATFSTGDLLRAVVKEKKAEGWEQLDADMKAGKLISSERVLFYLRDAVLKSSNKKILVDGYPRNLENMIAWDKMMGDAVDVKAALFFDCSAEEMRRRILGRNEGRADDNEKTIMKRIDVFEKETRPLAPMFEEQGLLVRIDCNRTKEEIFEDIKKKIIELNLA